jgi:ABC-type transport system substrate-binding protein
MLKKRVRNSLFFVLLLGCFFITKPISVESFTAEPFFELRGFTFGESKLFTDVMNFVSQHLKRIGIDLNVYTTLNWGEFLYELLWNPNPNFDLFYVGLPGGLANPDYSFMYSQDGVLNVFGYNVSLDWDDELGTGKNEWYLQHGLEIIPPDSEERIHHYWEWQDYFMDKILPIQPLFQPLNYLASWSNLQGYDPQKDLKHCWGNLSWDGLHEGQKSTSEIIISQEEWTNLNPFFYNPTTSDDIPRFILDSLITQDSYENFHPHLAQEYSFINDTHLRVHLREGIKWQNDPHGYFPNEYLTADDIVFSFYCWKYLSVFWESFYWLEDVKKVDQYTVDFFIDRNTSSPENEPFAPLLNFLTFEIMPEHYLNQTQFPDGITPDFTHDSWITYSQNIFGTSFFELDYYNQIEASLELFEDSWWFDPTVNKTNMNFEERFGDFSAGINKLTLKTVNNQDAAVALFRLGKSDLVHLGSQYNYVDNLQQDPNFAIHEAESSFLGYVGYNIRESREPIGNRTAAPGDPDISVGLAIRKAMAYAIDRHEICQVIFGDRYIIQDYPIVQTLEKWCNPDIIRYYYDLDKARDYMRIAGYGVDDDGFPSVGLTPWEISGIVIASVIFVGIITFVAVRAYKKTKI